MRPLPAARDAGRAALGGLALLACTSAGAGEWTVVPRLDVSERYTDNVNLAPRNANDDFILQVAPGLSVRGQGARLEMNLDYNYQLLRFANSSSRNTDNHQLQGDMTAELIRQILFIDAHSTVSQQLIDPTRPFTQDNFTTAGNRTTTVTWTVSPYLRHHLGRWADAEARFEFSRSDFGSASGVGASDIKTLSLAIDSGERFGRLGWGIDIRQSKTTREGPGQDVELDSIDGRASWRLSRQWRLNGTFGRSDNSFQSTRSSNDGFRWSAGVTWTPSRRTEVTLSRGEDFFGSTYSARARHRHKRWAFNADYSESVQTSASVQRDLRLIPLVDDFGNPVFDPALASNIPLPTDTPRITNEVFVNKRLSGGFTYTGRRNTVTVRFSDSRRELQVAGTEETTRLVSATWSHPLTRRLTLSANGSWQTDDGDDARGSDTRLSGGAALSYTLGRSISTSLSYRYEESSSDDGSRDFTRNVVAASVNLHL